MGPSSSTTSVPGPNDAPPVQIPPEPVDEMTPHMSTGRYQALVWWVLAAVATASHLSWATTAFGVITLFTLPGASILALAGINPIERATRLVYSVALSITVVMALGGLASLFGPVIGVHHPLGQTPTAIVFGVTTLGLVVAGTVKKRDAACYLLTSISWKAVVAVVVLSALPIGATLATSHLNNTGDGAQVVAVCLVAIFVLVGSVLAAYKVRVPMPIVLYFVAFAGMLTTSLRGYGLFGYDIQAELGVARTTAENGVFHFSNGNAYGAMLSLTTMPAQLLSLFHLPITDTFRVVDVAIGALIPVGAYLLVARRTTILLAGGLSAWLIVGSVALVREIPSITREEVALVIFAAFVMVLANAQLPLRTRQVLLTVFGVAIAFSHYTTAYLVSLMLLFAWLALSVIALAKGRAGKKVGNVIVFPVAAIVSVTTVLWNVVLNKSGGAITNQISSLRDGFGFLSTKGSLVSQVLRSQQTLSPSEFSNLMATYVREHEPWIIPGRNAANFVLRDAAPSATVAGPLHPLSPAFTVTVVLVAELLIVGLLTAMIFAAWRGWKKRPIVSTEYVFVAAAALIAAGLSRTSSVLAQLFNPERMALTVAIVLIVPFAELLHWLSMRRPWMPNAKRARPPRFRGLHLGVAAAALIAMVNTWQLGPTLFGGVESQTVSAGLTSHNDLTQSRDSLDTAKWILGNHRRNCVVNTDFFGQTAFRTFAAHSPCYVMGQLVPISVNHDAFVYLSPANVNANWAAGLYPTTGQSSIFEPPTPYFAANRSLIYASSSTRVYR